MSSTVYLYLLKLQYIMQWITQINTHDERAFGLKLVYKKFIENII